MTIKEYTDFDIETSSSVPVINSEEIDWKVSSVAKCIGEFIFKKSLGSLMWKFHQVTEMTKITS